MAVDTSTKGLFRQYLPDISIPRFSSMRTLDARTYGAEFKEKKQPPWLHALYTHWMRLWKEPFRGVTNDGVVRDGIFKLEDEGVEIEKIVSAAEEFLGKLSAEQKEKVSLHIDDPHWRTWSNPEFLLVDKGVRLEDLSAELIQSTLDILRASLSPEGYEKALAAMRINHFLGQLIDVPTIMNEYSYNFALFGTPSATRPWGYTFYGHHLCLNLFFYQRQLVIAPWFTGAEPNEIDEGPWAGTTIMRREEALGLQLMQSLGPELQSKAQIYKGMKDPAMPPGRWNQDDQRHVCGAYRDNRIVPYEGITVPQMPASAASLVWDIIDEYLLYLPSKSRQIRLQHAKAFESETYFSWIGGYGDSDPFYFRIQSPVLVVEFDHHSGVFLTNQEPEKFHIHTCFRLANAGDYGVALRRLIPGTEVKWADSEIVWR